MLLFEQENHRFTYGTYSIPSVSQLMRSVGIIEELSLPEIYLERGTFIHQMTELIDCDLYSDDMLEEENWKGFIDAYKMFLCDHEVEYKLSEHVVFNKELLYAGITDRVWKIDGVLHTTDIKTGHYAKWHPIQACAYNLVLGSHVTSCLYLKKDGSYELKEHESHESLVRSMSEIYWFRRLRDGRGLRKLIEKDLDN